MNPEEDGVTVALRAGAEWEWVDGTGSRDHWFSTAGSSNASADVGHAASDMDPPSDGYADMALDSPTNEGAEKGGCHQVGLRRPLSWAGWFLFLWLVQGFKRRDRISRSGFKA